MRIKNHKNGNQYLFTEGIWIRNLTLKNKCYKDINNLSSSGDYRMLLDNELQNAKRGIPQIDTENFSHKKILIISDGYDFSNLHRLCSRLPADVAVIAINRSLAKWELVGTQCQESEKRKISYYVVNNPYQECLSFLNKKNRYYPRCIVSSRTNPEFVEYYINKMGVVYQYQPTPEEGFSGGTHDAIWTIDDYRNPVCAALGLAYQFEAEKIALLGCDESFSDNRPGSILLENGLFTYPQHFISHSVIDGIFYWLKSQKEVEMSIVDASSGAKYKNAEYINPTELTAYFEG